MRDILTTYIRSLREQEQDKDAPESTQDLGTFICWLLERHGYKLHVRAYRHRGAMRISNRGKRQYGVDILASRLDEDGTDRIYRLVLKHGNITRANWSPGNPNSMLADLWEAAGLRPGDDSQHLLERSFAGSDRVTVVAVHNGEVRTDEIGPQFESQRDQICDRCAVELDWWDVDRLVELALAPPRSSLGLRALEEQADAALFPPAVRPFVRLSLDSMVRAPNGLGETFDIDAVDRAIEQILPLGGRLDPAHDGSGSGLSTGEPITVQDLYRKSSELALFAAMLQVECTRIAAGTTIPVLESIPRILCRIMDHLRRLSSAQVQGFKRKFHSLMAELIDRYIDSAQTLLDRLQPLLDTEYGLALPHDSERIDYPLRALRLASYLSLAGLACCDRDTDAHRGRAEIFADALSRLARRNPGGFWNPVTDDQIIEISALWMLWLQTGRHTQAAQSAARLLRRLSLRKRLGTRCQHCICARACPWQPIPCISWSAPTWTAARRQDLSIRVQP